MQRLSVPYNSLKRHKEYWEEKICPNLSVKIVKQFNELNDKQQLIVEMISAYIHDNWEDFAIGDNSKLRRHYLNITDKYNGKDEKINNYIIELLGYKKFSDRHTKTKWDPYEWACNMQTNVCPYCNRQYIEVLDSLSFSKNNIEKCKQSSSGNSRPDIEHYWSKSKYPYFSMSIYNWVPSCFRCNRSLKGDKGFDIENLTPYEIDLSKYIKFRINSIQSSTIVIDKEEALEKTLKKTVNDWCDIFELESQYNHHNNIVNDFIKKAQMYPDDILKDLYYKVLGKIPLVYDYEEFKSFLFGYPKSYVETDKEILGKFKLDMAEFVGIKDRDCE